MERPNDNPRVANTGRRADEERIYQSLFRVAEKNAEATGQPLFIPADAFTVCTRLHPNCVNLARLEGLDDETCIYALFWAILKRIPDADSLKANLIYGRSGGRQTACFRVGRRLGRSVEARIKHVGVYFSLTEEPDTPDMKVHNRETRRILVGILWQERILDPILSFLYKLYCITLRPYRIRIRDKRRARKENK